MGVIAFLKGRGPLPLLAILILALISGATNALLLVAVNLGADWVARGLVPDPAAWIHFGLAFLVYLVAYRISQTRAVHLAEGLLKDLRMAMVDRIRRSEKDTVERVKGGNLMNLLSQELDHLSETLPLLAAQVQQATLLLAAVIYLTLLSPPALAVFVLGTLVATILYLRLHRRMNEGLVTINTLRGQLFDAITDQIKGAKELRLNSAKAEAVFAAYVERTHALDRFMKAFGQTWSRIMMMTSLVTSMLLGVIVMALPPYLPEHALTLYQTVPVLLLCMGPLANLVGQWPLVARANMGLRALSELERQLDEGERLTPEEARAQAPLFGDFREITLHGLIHEYHGPDGAVTFTAGPLDLTIRRGEILYLVGGNGSGKTTMARALLALTRPSAGTIAVDGREVTRDNRGGYRELFAAIFTDFHLFQRIASTRPVDPERVERLLGDLGLAGKVRFTGGGFSTTALSTGQRKRLALLQVLLEDKPIYLFDEWSAEQDVHFRALFYTRILPDLRDRGATVIAITHDERYWGTADRVVRLNRGRLAWDRPGADFR